MSFALEWLDLREPADHAARDRGLLTAAAAHLVAVPAPVVVDLGAGSGATVRAFGSRVPDAHWRLIDREAGLLAAAAARRRAVETVEADLADVDRLPLDDARLVTASALFDLASEAFVGRLADRLTAAGVGLYAALTYDGTMVWEPAQASDGAVVAAFNAHQRGDKGLGSALGPEAGAAVVRAMADRGFAVRVAASPWRLRPADAALQARLVDGIAAAAAEAGLAAAAWGQARRAAATAGASSCTVGHVDVLALPA